MTRKSYDVLCAVTEYLKEDDFGICSNIRVHDLFPVIASDYMLEGTWIFYHSSINEIFYYTGVPCDLVYTVASDPDEFVYFYRLE